MGKTTRWLKGLFGMKSAASEPNSSKDRQRWGIGGSGMCHNPATIPPNITPAEAAWLKSYFPQANDAGETERNKHAVAVAAATAAAADAAVAAAQAAVEVVRLASRGRNRNNNNGFNLNRAAAVIQANFRGYLARKALRALKGLVKIQALVRGYLVRKQATATLHSMQALIRAQATVRSKRASIGPEGDPAQVDLEARCIAPPSPGQSRRLSASFEARTLNPPIEQDTPKVVEVDLGQPGSRSARRGTRSYSELGEDPGSYQAQFHFQSPSRLAPGRLSMPDHRHRCCHQVHCTEWECGPATTQTTPRFSGCGSQGEWGREQVYYQYPNYMSKTTSYKAKVRSVSAPKQRPEPNSNSNRKRMSLSEMMEGRNSLSGVRMQRSCSHVQQQPINFKNAVMGKFGRSSNWR